MAKVKNPFEKKATPGRGTRIKQVELEAALKFLNSDPKGARLQGAEHALVLLLKDELPRLKQYVFNAAYNLREIIENEKFQKAQATSSSLVELFNQTKAGAYVKVSLDREQLSFALFYEKQFEKGEALLFSRSFGEVIAATFAALGLDMTGLVALDPDSIKRTSD